MRTSFNLYSMYLTGASPLPPETRLSSSSVSSRVFSVTLFSLIVFSIQAIVVPAATLAQDISSHCEAVHHLHPNPTFRDGHHNGEGVLARDASRSLIAITRTSA